MIEVVESYFLRGFPVFARKDHGKKQYLSGFFFFARKGHGKKHIPADLRFSCFSAAGGSREGRGLLTGPRGLSLKST